ncbi:MAG: hypothetical protein ACJZ2J_01820 [Candidatus Poseidoniales archaeon]
MDLWKQEAWPCIMEFTARLDGMETVKIGKTVCRGYAEGYANGPAAYLAGDEVNYAGNTYWTDRHFLERTIQKLQRFNLFYTWNARLEC